MSVPFKLYSRFILPTAAILILYCLVLPVQADQLRGIEQCEAGHTPRCGHARNAERHLHAREIREAWCEEYEMLLAEGAREATEDTDLLHVDLEIEVDPASYDNLFGVATLTIQSKVDSLTQFTFRLRSQYAITSLIANIDTPQSTAVMYSTPSNTTRVVDLDRAYDTDEVFTLTIEYGGHAESRGFGSIEFVTHSGADIVFTLSEAYFSYTWWPAKDGDFGEPGDNSDKFTLDMSIIAPDSMVSASNGILESIDTLAGNRERYNWSSDYPIAPYLVCFSSTNYNTWEETYFPTAGGTMPVLFYIYPEHDSPSNRAAWSEVVDMMTMLRDYYGEYPFVEEKYGIYDCQFGGGMEHQTFTAQGTFSESVTAHELGHQWWGDMITCKTWNDIWLNEGFACFTECLWEEVKSGTPNLTAYLNATQARKPSSVGDSVYVYDTTSMSRIFSSTYTYDKGCWVVHQLRHVVGDATFFDILADYRSAYAYSAATTEDFAAIASAAYGSDLTWFFDQWVYQIGAPAYRYGWQSINVNGQDYLLARIQQTQSSAYPDVFIMPVDLQVTIAGSPQTLTVWNDAETEWFVVPVSGTVTALQFDPNEWILRTNASSENYVAGPPTIVDTYPAPGEEISCGSSVDTVTVTFHSDVNTNAGHYLLSGATTGTVPVAFSYNSGTQTVTLTASGDLPSDFYTLTVSQTLTGASSGMQLDGELTDPNDPASLPSGEGLAGGDTILTFSVGGSSSVADIDENCLVDDADVILFVNAVLGDTTEPYYSNSDVNGNGLPPDGEDIQPFVNAFVGS